MFTVLSNTRNSNLYLIAALAIMVVVLLTLAIAPSISLRGPAVIPVTEAQNTDLALAFRRGEWTTGASAYQAYLDQRYGEQHQGHAIDAQAAYLEFRQGEQTTGVNAANAYIEFRRGEWSGK
jgi:cell division protein FtsW (lipid II flippase)